MNESKKLAILGVAILAGLVVEVSASKRRLTPVYYYETPTKCKAVVENFVCAQVGFGCKGTQGAAVGKQLYRDRISSSECDVPLKSD